MPEERGRVAKTIDFACAAAGCAMLLAVGGCVSSESSPDALGLAQANVAGSATAGRASEEASTNKKSETETAAATSKKDAEAETSASALALAAKAPQPAAVAAANSAVAEAQEKAATSDSGADKADVKEGATDASADGRSAQTEVASAAKAEVPGGPASEQTQPPPLFRLFSGNRTGKQARPIRSVSTRDDASTPVDDEPPAPADGADSADAEVDPTEVGSIPETHEAMDSLPGVRLQSLYQFPQADQDSASQARVELASAAGMARLSSGFLIKQRDSVQTSCLKPALLGLLKLVQYHYGRPVVITSGYRGPIHNRRVGGVRHSKHMSCEAADIQVEGISKWDLAGYLRALPGRGGVGTYCYTDSVHVDVGDKRDWNWRCRRRK